MSCLRHTAPASQVIGRLVGHDKENGRVLGEWDLVCCGHCGYVFSYKPGSGKLRGWCTAHGMTCGHKDCRDKPCRSWKQWFDNKELGLPDEYKPIQILVPGVPAA
jgi:hypothetical protein